MLPREPSTHSRTILLLAFTVPTKTSQFTCVTACHPRLNYPSTNCGDLTSTPAYWHRPNCMVHLISASLLLPPWHLSLLPDACGIPWQFWMVSFRLALKSYQCYMVWITEMHAQCICNMLMWLPTKVPMPTASSIDLVLARIQDIATALQNPSANSLLAPLTDSQGAASTPITNGHSPWHHHKCITTASLGIYSVSSEGASHHPSTCHTSEGAPNHSSFLTSEGNPSHPTQHGGQPWR